MSFIKRVWSTLTVLTLAIIMLPSAGHAVQADPYRYTTILGLVDLQYERYRAEELRFTEETKSFQQLYSLTMLGQVLSRKLMVYDMGVTWKDINYQTKSTDRKTKVLDYFFTTTLLPLSKIPLTLYANKTETDMGGTFTREDSRITYGLNWMMNFRTLPKTRIHAERRINDLSGTETIETNFELNMEKDLGPTENTFAYYFNASENPSSSDPYTRETIEHIFNLTNVTHISKSTLFSIGGTRGIQKHPESNDGDITITGLSASFTSRPSEYFTQIHHYTYFNNVSDSGEDNTGHYYTGDMKYWIAEDLRSSLDLSIERRDDDTRSNRLELNSLTTQLALDWFPTDNLTLSELISYSDYRSNSGDPLTPNTGSREEFSAISRARYSRPLDWARMSVQYSVGYSEKAFSEEGSGAGIDQEVSGALGAININRYLGFETNARHRRLDGISGDIWERETSFSFDTYNKQWQEYVEVLASYDRASSSGWVNILTRKTEKYTLDAKTELLNNTKVAFHAETGFSAGRRCSRGPRRR
jgi:hypothetical protein